MSLIIENKSVFSNLQESNQHQKQNTTNKITFEKPNESNGFLPINRTQHPIDERKPRNCIQKGKIWPPFQQKNNGIQ